MLIRLSLYIASPKEGLDRDRIAYAEGDLLLGLNVVVSPLAEKLNLSSHIVSKLDEFNNTKRRSVSLFMHIGG